MLRGLVSVPPVASVSLVELFPVFNTSSALVDVVAPLTRMGNECV